MVMEFFTIIVVVVIIKFLLLYTALAGIARLCCDSRRYVRSQALTYLQRALLMHDLQTLSAAEWESCFNKVLVWFEVNTASHLDRRHRC